MKEVGDYLISESAMWDTDLERWYVRIAIPTKNGEGEIHYTAHAKTGSKAEHMASVLARVMSATKPASLRHTPPPENLPI